MLKWILFLVITQFLISSASAKQDLVVHVKDHLGQPVQSITIKIKGKGTQETNDEGVAVFPKSAKIGDKCKVSVDGTPIFKEFSEKMILRSKKGKLTITLGWTNEKWRKVTNHLRTKKMNQIDSLIVSTDFTVYDSCDDSLGNHFETEAEFPGGSSLFQGFILDHLIYPQNSIDMDEQGKVYVSFVVEADGSISTIKIKRGVSRDLDREAKRLIRSLPKWIPGTCNGEKISTRCLLPLVFTLN